MLIWDPCAGASVFPRAAAGRPRPRGAYTVVRFTEDDVLADAFASAETEREMPAAFAGLPIHRFGMGGGMGGGGMDRI